MGLPAKKKKDDELAVDPADLTTEREQKLARNFQDPALEELIPGLQGDEPHLSLVEETVEAVQELVQEAVSPEKGSNPTIDLTTEFGGQNLTLVPDSESAAAPGSFAVEGGANESSHEAALWAMAEKLFQLVVCEKSFDDLSESILTAVMSSVQAQAGSMLELDEAKQDFFFRANSGGASPPDRLKAFRVPLGKGIVGHVAESKQPLLLRDLEDDKLQMRAISMSVGFEAKTCMAAPILIGGKLYGVVEVFNKTDGSLFEQEDLRVLECGVRMVAKVLEVRFLMAELLRRMR